MRRIPSGEINPAGGIGSVEAPRGTLTHHYEADERGLVTRANLIVGTTNNYAPISHVAQAGGREADHRAAR